MLMCIGIQNSVLKYFAYQVLKLAVYVAVDLTSQFCHLQLFRDCLVNELGSPFAVMRGLFMFSFNYFEHS